MLLEKLLEEARPFCIVENEAQHPESERNILKYIGLVAAAILKSAIAGGIRVEEPVLLHEQVNEERLQLYLRRDGMYAIYCKKIDQEVKEYLDEKIEVITGGTLKAQAEILRKLIEYIEGKIK